MRSVRIGVLGALLLGCGTTSASHGAWTQSRVAFAAEAGGRTSGPQVVVGSARWIGAAPAQEQLVAGGDGQTYVGVWVDTPRVVATQRPPVDLALVIDNSGSMAGAGIENARVAAVSLLESLSDGDIVSVYTFETAVHEVAAPTLVSAATRAALIQRVQGIVPMGSTNMYDALRVAETRMAQAPATHAVRRIVMISDGMANVGPSSPAELGVVAAGGTEYGAQVSAIGVGLQYDERTLNALAVQSAGRLYHLADPSQMAPILREELNLLAASVASDAWLEVVPAAGVQILGVEGEQIHAGADGRVRVPLGTLYGGQHRQVLLRARVNTDPTGAATRGLATARLVYREPNGARAARAQDLAMEYRVTADAAAATRSRVARVQGMVASYEASQQQLRAAALLNQGQAQQAAAVLEQAQRRVEQTAFEFTDELVQGELRVQAAQINRRRESAARATTPAASRASALENNQDAMRALGH